MGKEITVKLIKVKEQTNSLNIIYKEMNQYNQEIKRISGELKGSIREILKPLNTVIEDNNEVLDNLKQLNSVLKEIVQQYQNAEEKILATKISEKNISTEKNTNSRNGQCQ